MGSGLSMASVNKIKELAAQREYSLALDIIDSQDLTKSLNPQFLRLCGEIFIKSKRYADARKVLVMAHRMAPEAKRIIFDLVELYTKMGYKELVDLYYTIYMYDAEEDSIDTKQLKYLYDKYNGNSIEQIRDYIIPYYTDNMDYDWSFEAYLLLMLYDDEDDEQLLKALVDEYSATYKNSDNYKMLESIRDDKTIANSKFYNFNKEAVSDDDVSQKDIRREERKQLEIDNERINPPEATIIEESDEEEDEKTSRGFFKRKNKKDEQVDNEEDMNKDSESSDTEDNTSADEKDDSGESEKSDNKKTGLFRRMFSRKKEEQSTDKSETDETDTVEGKQEEVKPDETEVTQEEVKSEEAKDRQEEAEPEEAKDKQEEAEPEEAKNKQEKAEPEDTETFESETPESEIGQETEPVQPETFEESDTEYNENQNNYIDGEKDMHGGKNSIDLNNEDFFSEDDFDDFSDSENEIDEFAAESETIDELHAKESKSFNFVLKENTDEKPDEEDDNSNKSGKAAFVFEDVDISYEDEDDEEYEIDDFSSSKPDEFGQMYDTVEESDTYADEYKAEAEVEEVEAKTEYESELEAEVVEDAETEYEPEAEIEEVEAKTEYEAEPEYEPETEVVEDAETEYEPEAEVEEVEAKTEYEAEPEYEPEAAVEEAETEYEPEAEIEEVEAKTEYEAEPEAEVVEEAETEYEPEAEIEEVEAETEYEAEPEYEPEAEIEEVEDKTEYESEPEAEVVEEAETEYEPEAEIEEVEAKTEYEAEPEYEPEAAVEEAETESEPEPEEEPEDDLSPEDLRELYRIERDKIKNQNKEKKLDFPVFRSSLFPNYHNDLPEVENNFEEIMTDSKNKIDENFEKEARLQRETEELLASLGINVSSMKPSLKEMETKPQKVEKTVINKEPGISRSQLKDSLKIDANKKTILRKMKEYR